MANTYDRGDLVRISGTFKVAGVATDPTAPTFRIKAPDGTVTTYVSPTDAQLVKDSTGAYHVDWPITQAGIHRYRFEGTGAAQAAEEGVFSARVSGVL